MNKLVVLVFATVLFALPMSAQTFEKGSQVLNVGLGIGSIYGTMRLPGINGAYEIGVTEKIGIGYISAGGFLGLTFNKDYFSRYGGNLGYNYTHIIITPRAAYHFDLVEDFDFYAGLAIGANLVLSKARNSETEIVSDPAYENGVYPSVFAGARYYVSPNFALMSELGFGAYILNLGVSYKF